MNADDPLPPGWARTTLGEVTVPQVPQGPPRPGAAFTYIDISSIDNVGKRIVGPRVLEAGEAPGRARQHVRAGDVLVSLTRPNLNAVALVPPELDGSIASTGFHVLRGLGVLPEWLLTVVRSRPFVEAMSRIVQGALYPAIRPDDVRSYPLDLPPLPEQGRIVARAALLSERARKARAQLEAAAALLDQLDRAVFARAVRGDLVPQDPAEEPAVDLLRRIRAGRATQEPRPRKRWAPGGGE
jgi:type I restriction enzyme S subunit